MDRLFDKKTKITPAVLNAIANIPTKNLPRVASPCFWQNLSDADFIRVAVYVAQINYEEGTYPIGALIVDNKTRAILGKSHNATKEDDHPYNHGARVAVKDTGYLNFRKTTMYITFNPCDVCSEAIINNHFKRVVVGDVTNTSGNEHRIISEGIKIDILEDQMAIDLYKKYKEEILDADLPLSANAN